MNLFYFTNPIFTVKNKILFIDITVVINVLHGIFVIWDTRWWPANVVQNIKYHIIVNVDLGGLVVSVFATGPNGFLRVIKIRSTTSFGGEVKPSVPCRRFTACKRTLRAWIKMLRKLNCLHFSPKSPDCLPDGSGGHIRIDRIVARPVDQSPTATNAHDLVTSKTGGPGPYMAVEPWLYYLLL
jgi:hypothetical protein